MKDAQWLLNKLNMAPDFSVPVSYYKLIAKDMAEGLSGREADMAMIPTYLSNDGVLPLGVPAAIIDAGGTNFRCGLVTFTEEGYEVSDFAKYRMPGAVSPATWEEFISFSAEKLEPLMDRTDVIGFVFSYEAEITPEMDGRVVNIDKEVKVTDSKGKLIGKSLSEELAKRGWPGKKVVILNDTVAVLLGGTAGLDKTSYSGFVGQVSGTGTNTCCMVPCSRIGKVKSNSDSGMIINMECGSFGKLPSGVVDTELDADTDMPGLKLLEKKTAGAYLGKIARLVLNHAYTEKMISESTYEAVKALGEFDTSVVDAWSQAKGLDCITDDRSEIELIKEISIAILKRSAICMGTVLLGIAEFTDSGKTREMPLCDCAEGSLVQKSRVYRETLLDILKSFEQTPGRFVELKVVEESTVPGSAAAALLNIK